MDNDLNNQFATLNVGLIGLGLEAYWAQFPGLEERLLGYISVVEEKIAAPRRTIHNLGLIDTPHKATAAAHACRTNDVDILLIYVTTYALSSTILPVVRRAKVPVLLLNIQPAPAIDYETFNAMNDRTAMTSEWLAFCSACPMPEIANVLRRLDIPCHQVTGMLHNDSACWADIEEWLHAAEVMHALAHSRLGLMGHYYNGMLDIATDLVQVSGRFGIHIEMPEVDELTGYRRAVDADAIAEKVATFREYFDVGSDCAPAELDRAAKTSVALDRLIAAHSLDMMAYYYKGTGVAENENTLSSIILGATLLTGNGVAVAGEYEVKNVIAMKIMDLLGVGGSFTEYYAMDFDADLVLMGHDGPAHAAIAQDRIKVRRLQVYHGKVGSGLSVEMSVRHGPVTLLSIVEDGPHGFMLLIAEGESVAGAVLEIGNTNSRYRFPPGARRFVESWNAHGPAHHCAVGIGHVAHQLEKVARLLDLRSVQVC